MIKELKITITTSTDTNGDAIELMEETLADIVDWIADADEKSGQTGEIEEYGYAVHWEYKIREI